MAETGFPTENIPYPKENPTVKIPQYHLGFSERLFEADTEFRTKIIISNAKESSSDPATPYQVSPLFLCYWFYFSVLKIKNFQDG